MIITNNNNNKNMNNNNVENGLIILFKTLVVLKVYLSLNNFCPTGL